MIIYQSVNHMKKQKQMSESLLLGIILAVAGGYLDSYTYISRGGVFANAQTGNIVLLGVNLARGDFSKVLHYLIPVAAFAIGIIICEAVKSTLKDNTHIHWRQLIILLEIVFLFTAAFIPTGKTDIVVNTMISFVCSLQAGSFRVINGNAMATTMCTGNLRSGTQQLFIGLHDHSLTNIKKSLNYYSIILFFIAGAAAGTLITNRLGGKSVFICAALLIIPFIMMFKQTKREEDKCSQKNS